MVHGGCSSIGCYAMTDPVVDEIWRVVTAALKGGQPRFHVHVFPFRMTDANLSLRSHMPVGAVLARPEAGLRRLRGDAVPPRISVCQGRYAVSRPPRNADGSHDIDSQCAPAAAARS